jgi:hypothetical protein
VVAVGIWLGAVGVADMVADLSGHPSSLPRIVAGLVAGTAVAALGGLAVGLPLDGIGILAVVTAATLGPWLWIRRAPAWSAPRALAGLGLLVLLTGGALATSGLWPATDGGLAGRAVGSLAFPAIAGAGVERVVLFAGTVLWLTASANGVVRLVLASMTRDVPPGQEPLKGGRIIGPMERWLILGLVLGGAPTAAGLVVAAKGLVRYAEIRGAGIEWKTEYLLVGSLTSWLLALLPVVLLA